MNNILKKSKKLICLFLTLIISFLLTISCSKNTDPTVIDGFYFNTFIQIVIYDNVSDDIKLGVSNLCDYYDRLFSISREDSELFIINNSSKTEISEEMFNILFSEKQFSEDTDRVIDATIGTVYELWDFTGETSVPPSEEAVTEALKYTGFDQVILTEENDRFYIEKPLECKITLGYMAKGYISGKIADYLKTGNINNAIINLGGNVMCIGSKPDNTEYAVGIEYPFSIKNESITALSIDSSNEDMCVITSGIYERYFTYNGSVYHHLLNTSTGYPEQNNLLSVTVIGSDPLICDRLSTACFLMGMEKAKQFMEKYPDYSALFINEYYETETSDNFPEQIRIY